VLDRQIRKPIQNVALGKYEKGDTANSYPGRIYAATTDFLTIIVPQVDLERVLT
jgi:hypothetical protein